MRPNAHSGMHHLALNVKNLESAVKFYTDLLGLRIVWQPDADNYYLSSGNDNLALHRAPEGFERAMHQQLDHLGFYLTKREDVDQWHDFLVTKEVEIKKAPKDHRDGTRSFYCADPDGNTVQFIYFP